MRFWEPAPPALKKASTSSSTRMEIGCFAGGATSTASDQSKSSGTASGSSRTAFSISSSVSAATRAQSVFPGRRSSLETIVISSSLVPACPPCGDEPADIAADRERDGDFLPVDVAEDLVSGFAMAIRSTDESVAVEYSFQVREVDVVNAQIGFAFLLMPSERANARNQTSD